jgi:hypothetical protein
LKFGMKHFITAPRLANLRSLRPPAEAASARSGALGEFYPLQRRGDSAGPSGGAGGMARFPGRRKQFTTGANLKRGNPQCRIERAARRSSVPSTPAVL